MSETERPPQQDASQHMSQEQIAFAAKLQELTRIPNFTENFSEAARQLLGASEADIRNNEMIWFLSVYEQQGLNEALKRVEGGNGIPVAVEQPPIEFVDGEARRTNKPKLPLAGRIVGLAGCKLSPSGDVRFYGVAAIEGIQGKEEFAAVRISPNGTTVLLSDHLNPSHKGVLGKSVATNALDRILKSNPTR